MRCHSRGRSFLMALRGTLSLNWVWNLSDIQWEVPHCLHGGPMARNKDVLTTGEVARICKVAPRTVTKWFDSGQLRGYRIPGSKDRRIPVTQLIRFMRQNNMPLDGMMNFTKTRILIVDDEAEIVDMLR